MALSTHGIDAFDIGGPGAPRSAAPVKPVKATSPKWQMNCTVDERLRKPLKVACAALGITIGDYVQPLVVDQLEQAGFINREQAEGIRSDQGTGL